MQQLNRPKIRRRYDRTGGLADFKIEIVNMLTNGQTAAYVSKALSSSENL